MMKIYQTLKVDSLATRYYTSQIAGQYAAYEGIVHDLDWVATCLLRIAAAMDVAPMDRQLISAFTWQVVVLYARCFEPASDGRRAALGDRALRLLDNDERRLHEGLLEVRSARFAHAGMEANHRALCALMPDGVLELGFEIEGPDGMFDHGQVALTMAVVGKFLRYATTKRDQLQAIALAELQAPERSATLVGEMRAAPHQVQPEVIALQFMRQIQTE